jgi:cytochrome c6
MNRIRTWLIPVIVVFLALSSCLPEEEAGLTPEIHPQPTFPGEPPPTPSPPPPTPDEPRPTPTPQETTPTPQSADEMVAFGQDIYIEACAACHRPAGVGVVGAYPPLDGNAFVAAVDPAPLIQVIITGRGGMPGFYEMLEDYEIAAVVSYIRTAWTNQAEPVNTDEVNAAWAASDFPMDDDDEDDED